jgi:hypothetical protein
LGPFLILSIFESFDSSPYLNILPELLQNQPSPDCNEDRAEKRAGLAAPMFPRPRPRRW